jgi:hypothetical protein
MFERLETRVPNEGGFDRWVLPPRMDQSINVFLDTRWKGCKYLIGKKVKREKR